MQRKLTYRQPACLTTGAPSIHFYFVLGNAIGPEDKLTSPQFRLGLACDTTLSCFVLPSMNELNWCLCSSFFFQQDFELKIKELTSQILARAGPITPLKPRDF